MEHCINGPILSQSIKTLFLATNTYRRPYRNLLLLLPLFRTHDILGPRLTILYFFFFSFCSFFPEEPTCPRSGDTNRTVQLFNCHLWNFYLRASYLQIEFNFVFFPVCCIYVSLLIIFKLVSWLRVRFTGPMFYRRDSTPLVYSQPNIWNHLNFLKISFVTNRIFSKNKL